MFPPSGFKSNHQQYRVNLGPEPRVAIRGGGLLRRQARFAPTEQRPDAQSDARTDSLIACFLSSQGLPFETVQDPTFVEMVRNLNPKCVIPTARVLEANAERVGNPARPVVNFMKTQGALSVTVHVTEQNRKNYLAFSIHYFDEKGIRENVVYLKEIMMHSFDQEYIQNLVRRAVNTYNISNIKFTNLVCPNEFFFDKFERSEVFKRVHVCFYESITQFATEIIYVEDFMNGLEELRAFLIEINGNPELENKLRRISLSLKTDTDLPILDNAQSWESTAVFLARCLILHDVFFEFGERWHVKYISHKTFVLLYSLHRILQQCLRQCRELSTPLSSISQIIPSIMAIRHSISSCDVKKETSDQMHVSYTALAHSLHHPERCKIATLLDPRYAYKTHIITQTHWMETEKKLIVDFMKHENTNSERNFEFNVDKMSVDERSAALTEELKKYRHLVLTPRPEITSNPFTWWCNAQQELKFLPTLAKEYLACPAVAVDSEKYFGEGGKFSRVCKTYNHQRAERLLNAGGIYQEFQGRRDYGHLMLYSHLEQVNTMANRRQKELNVQFLNAGADSSQMNELMRSEYPPPPTVNEIRKRPKFEEELKPATIKIFDTDTFPRKEDTAGSTSVASEEAKPEAFFHSAVPEETTNKNYTEREIKEEPIESMEGLETNSFTDFIEPKTEITSPTTTTATSSEALKSKPLPLVNGRIVPPPNRPPPQNIVKANFVQKFAQEQKFVVRKPDAGKLNSGGLATQPKQETLNTPAEKVIFRPEMNQRHVAMLQSSLSSRNQRYQDDYLESPSSLMPSSSGSIMRRHIMDDEDPNDMPTDNNISYEKVFEAVQADKYMGTAYYRPRKPCNRRCAVCNILEEHDNLKNATIDTEKCIVVLACVYEGKMSVADATAVINRQTKTYICRGHFGDACNTIFKILKVKTPIEIASIPMNSINTVVATLNEIRGQRMNLRDFRRIVICFTRKYYVDPSDETSKEFLQEQIDDLTVPNFEEGEDEDDILPKGHRQPRKQILEADIHGETVKLIEQEPVKFPNANNPTLATDDNNDIENPEKCCYCSTILNRLDMMKVPKTEERLERWYHSLGDEFRKHVKSNEDNYICRSHFPEDAFSTRGRLLKGKLPRVEQEKVEVVYKIQGSDFLKLGESRIGTEKTASIDLARNTSRPLYYPNEDETDSSQSDFEDSPPDTAQGSRSSVEKIQKTVVDNVGLNAVVKEENQEELPVTSAKNKRRSAQPSTSEPLQKVKKSDTPVRTSSRLQKKQ